MGFDSPEGRQSAFTNAYIARQFDELQTRYRDRRWLERHHDRVYHCIRRGLTVQHLAERSVDALFGVADYMLTRQDYQQWSKLLMESLVVAYDLHNEPLLLHIYSLLGQSFLLSGEIGRARTAFFTITERDIVDDRTAEMSLLAYIGLLCTETHGYTNTATPEMVERALRLTRRLRDPFLTALLHTALCAVHAHYHAFTEALAYGQTALGYWYQRQNHAEIGKTALRLGVAFRLWGKLPDARRLLGVAQRRLGQGGSVRYQALAAYELGVVHYLQGHYTDAERWLKGARRAFKTLDWQHSIAMSDQVLGEVYTELGRFDEAQRRLERALSLWHKLDNRFEQANALYDLADLARRQGEWAAAESHLRRGLAHLESLPETAPSQQLQALTQKTLDEVSARHGGAAANAD